ncbi:MAG: aminotransferase class IV [Candidatus Dadabacteria bacterium]|nr:aminotransferase class IV [Candidatus Dadabacteria bacterium]
MEELVLIDKKPVEEGFPLRALFFGEGVFETFRCRGGLPVFIDRHISRLKRGAEALHIPYPGDGVVEEYITHALGQSGLRDAYFKLCLLSRGRGTFSLLPEGCSLAAVVRPYSDSGDSYRVKVSAIRRHSTSPLCGIKSLNYLDSIIARREARADGCDEAVFLNEKGFVAEGTASNVFWISGDELLTPSVECGLLPGVMRSVVLEVGREIGMEVREGEFGVEQALRAEAVFLTNSSIAMASVREFEGWEFDAHHSAFAALRDAVLKKLGWV